MSTERDFDEREQRDWDAQERALRAERGGESAASDAHAAQYRLVARALREPPLDSLPQDFAARVAARVTATAPARGTGERIESWLEGALVALLLCAGAAALIAYNGDALRELSFKLPEGAGLGIQTVVSWGLAVAACVGLSSALAIARKR
jgi:hypothetical protein